MKVLIFIKIINLFLSQVLDRETINSSKWVSEGPKLKWSTLYN